MRISTKNLQDTCSFLVNECRREVKATPNFRVRICDQHRKEFRALSLLLVGFPEKRIVQAALDDIRCIEYARSKEEAA